MRAGRTMLAWALLGLLLAPSVLPSGRASTSPPGAVERLSAPADQDLKAVAWRPVPGDSYALVAGNAGTVFEYTGRFFIKLSANTTEDLTGIGWRPDGSGALVVGRSGTVMDFDGNLFTNISSNGTEWYEGVAWRPQGDFALLVGRSGLLARYEGGALSRLNSTVNYTIDSVSWRPDGRLAILCGDFPFVLRYDSATGGVMRLETGLTGQFLRFVAWRPDGSAALVAGTVGNIFRYDGTSFTPLDSPTADQWLAAAWAADNRTALLAASGGLLYLYEEGQPMLAVATNTTASIFSIAYVLNGSFALAVGAGGLVLRYPAPTTGTQPPATPPKATTDSAWLIFSGAALLAVSLLMVGVAAFTVHRARGRERQRRELVEAELHAATLALKKRK